MKILHDSVLARTLKKPAWHGKRFQSIIKWPDRMDLWDTWEAIYTDNSEEGGPDAALAYYSANRAAMEAGAEVSWPSYRPLYKLMCKRAENHDAFDSEQQNDPLSTGNAPFAAVLVLWTELPSGLLPFGACDPSLGKAGKGRDPSALLVGGLHRDTMRLFTLEALIRRRHPDRIIQDMIALQQRYNCLLWAVETVQFQAFFADVAVQRAIASGTPLPIQPVVNSADKELRIETLQPYMPGGTHYYPDAGFDYNPGQTFVADLKANMPEPPQTAASSWRGMGLPSLRDVPTDRRQPTPAMLPMAPTRDAAAEQLAKALGFEGDERLRTITTPMGQRTIWRDNLPHLVAKEADARERYANYVLPTLEQPYEVWLKEHTDGKLRENYVGIYQEGRNALLVVVRINRDGSLLWNMMQRPPKDMDRLRDGWLVWNNTKR